MKMTKLAAQIIEMSAHMASMLALDEEERSETSVCSASEIYIHGLVLLY